MVFIREYFLENGTFKPLLYVVRNPSERKGKGMALQIGEEKARPLEERGVERIKKK